MLIVMDRQASQEQIARVLAQIEKSGLRSQILNSEERTVIVVSGGSVPVDARALESLAGVRDVLAISEGFRLTSRETQRENSRFDIGGVEVGGASIVIIGGPCAVESLDQLRRIAEGIKQAGGHLLRGGAFKPRTSPYSFQGLGERGLDYLTRVREEFDLPFVTEAVDGESLELVRQYADAVQIGARSMQNFALLRAAGRGGKPVLLKRGAAATVTELLLSAEYLMAEGNRRVLLCERGIRSFGDHSRNTLDLSAVAAIKEVSHLPVIVDPSHATGRRRQVLPMARAGIAAGADGVLIEVHHAPHEALSDGAQSILPDEFVRLVQEVGAVARSIGRDVAAPMTSTSRNLVRD